MVTLEVALRWTAERSLTGVRILELELSPHDNPARAFLGLVYDKRTSLKVKVAAYPIVHERENPFFYSLLRMDVLKKAEVVCASDVRATIHENVLLARVTMEVAVEVYFAAI